MEREYTADDAFNILYRCRVTQPAKLFRYLKNGGFEITKGFIEQKLKDLVPYEDRYFNHQLTSDELENLDAVLILNYFKNQVINLRSCRREYSAVLSKMAEKGIVTIEQETTKHFLNKYRITSCTLMNQEELKKYLRDYYHRTDDEIDWALEGCEKEYERA